MLSNGGKWADGLNTQQLAAVTHDGGPLLVVAGAGTGKTRTLAHRVSYLISQGVSPERILLLTFTRRAAEEMLKRAASALSDAPLAAKRVWGGTFHSFANRILRMYGKSAGLSQEFTIMDRTDAEDFLDVIRNDLSLSKTGARFPRKSTCMAIYSRRVNADEALDVVLKKSFPWCIEWVNELKKLFRAYVERKQKQNVLDYDDLLLYLYFLLEDEEIAELIENRFEHVLVDEYQDTNRIQAGILGRMRQRNKKVTVVGDDAQSIYSFRSATIKNMLDFPNQFPCTRIVTLEQNYRSVEPVLLATNCIIRQAKNRYSKELWSSHKTGEIPQLITCRDESHQDQMVIDRILEHYEQGIPLRRQAVLFRAASHSASLEIALANRNIPFRKYGGLRFLETAHIKDLVSILRIAENPRDQIAWFRVLQLISGVGPQTAASVYEHVVANEYDPVSITTSKVSSSMREQITSLGELMCDLTHISSENTSTQIERILQFYRPLMEQIYEDFEPRANDIYKLSHLAQRYNSREQFLSELLLEPPISTGDFAGPPTKDEDWLVLSTIHSAKGLEWDAVYLIHAADGCLPADLATEDDETIEEELRLTYVAMTRARDFLYVLWPLRYYSRASRSSDGHCFAQCSRFFTPEVVATMKQVSFSERKVLQLPTHNPKSPRNISNRIQEFWR
jgi:DNA helicase-2/ATP-dependent DNA helicase PcrA